MLCVISQFSDLINSQFAFTLWKGPGLELSYYLFYQINFISTWYCRYNFKDTTANKTEMNCFCCFLLEINASMSKERLCFRWINEPNLDSCTLHPLLPSFILWDEVHFILLRVHWLWYNSQNSANWLERPSKKEWVNDPC